MFNVLTLIWREHPYLTLAEEFQAPLAAILELTPGAESASHESRGPAAEKTVIRSIQGMLGVANDAQLEGRSAGIDPAKLIDALDTFLRIAFLVVNAARPVTSGGESAISPDVLNAVRYRFEAWLESLRAEPRLPNPASLF